MKNSKILQKILAGTVIGAMAFSLVMTAVPASAAKKKKAREVDLNGTYHATMGIQTATDLWITRMGYYEKSQNEYYNTENADKMFCQSKETGENEMQPGIFTDAEIKGNGTYTVSLDGAEFSGETVLSQLHVATDIPVNDTIQFSNVYATINGRKVAEFQEGFMEDQEPYLQGGMVCLIINHWRPELVNTLSDQGLSESSDNGYPLLQGTGEERVSITFTISGFEYDNPDAQQVAEGGETDSEMDSDTGNEGGTGTESASGAGDASSASVSSSTVIAVVIILVVIVLAAIVVTVNRKKKKS